MRTLVVSFDKSARRLMCIIIALLGLIALELWVDRSAPDNSAFAQIPDTGLQRQLLVEESRKTNELLSAILDHLRNQRVKVLVESADKTVKSPPAKRP